MTLQDRFKGSDDVVFRDIAGEMVLLNLSSGLYYGLDPVGSRIWETFSEGPCAVSKVCDVVEAQFDASRDVIERDVLALVEDLLENELIHRVPS